MMLQSGEDCLSLTLVLLRDGRGRCDWRFGKFHVIVADVAPELGELHDTSFTHLQLVARLTHRSKSPHARQWYEKKKKMGLRANIEAIQVISNEQEIPHERSERDCVTVDDLTRLVN